MKITLLSILLTLLVINGARAHDFWLQAHPFIAAVGEPVEISARIGQQLVGDSQPNILNWYTDFSYTQNNARRDVPGEMGRDPAGIIRKHNPGTFVVGYQSVRRTADFDRAVFEKYLRDEGLDSYLSHRTLDSQRDIVEHYTRYAKALVRSGSNTGLDQSQANFNYLLELHSLKNPYDLKTGENLPLRLTFDGRPVAGVLVTAFCETHPQRRQQQRSNSAGEVSISPDCQGMWLIKAVLMQVYSTQGIDFESFWASLTFEVR